MDLAFTPEERQFADEVRAFVRANLPADIRDKVKNGKHLVRDDYMRWQQALGKQGWLVYTWPKKHGGPGFTPAAALHLREYLRRGICAGHHPVRHQDGRAGDLHLRQRGAEGEVPRADPQEHRVVVPGLFRAGLGLRPRVAPHQGGEAGRPLHRQRLEDLEHDGPLGRLDLLPGAHRSQGQAAGRHLLPADRHEDAGHHREAHHHGRRRP